jgi:hypothetical protein
VNILHKRQFYGTPFTFISRLYNYYQPLDVLSVVSCVEICIVSTMGIFPKYSWLTTLKSKIINNFKIFHMMCYEVCKYIYIYNNIYSHVGNISKINKINVWASSCIFSCYALRWSFYIFVVSWVLDVVCRCVHGCDYCFCTFFVSWQLDIIYCVVLCYYAGNVLTSVYSGIY